MASYYAQIDVNITDASGNVVKTTTPKVPKNESTKPKKPKDDNEDVNVLSVTTKTIGLVTSSIAFANSAVGSYTGNKTTQSNINTTLGLVGMGLAIAHNPLVGGLALAGFAIKRTTDIIIEQKNSEQESAYNQSYMGKMTTSGSRWKGGSL